jgi:CheY-like chemotaxis protein
MAKLVLYVEDEDDDIFLVQHAFKKAEVPGRLVVLPDGRAAMDYLSGHGEYADRQRHPRPQLVLLDLNLPIQSGFEVLAWVRRQPALRTLPVVALTSSNNEADIHRAYELGANAYLIKPSNADKLLGLVKSFAEFWLVYNAPPPPGLISQ